MTDSASETSIESARRPGKRDRLIAAAARLLHEQGVERTTLAEIAQLAEVPAGNVYYYFKTKDEVIAAVVEAHAQRVRSTLAAIDAKHRSSKGRLRALIRELTGHADVIAQHGCPLGSLCSELDKRLDLSDFAVAQLMLLFISWAEEQFRELGQGRHAHDSAVDLLASYQGGALLTNTLRDPQILAGTARRLDQRIADL
jgi:TetR/AcrR family transcriptional regulator, transcriptional repressor for nem operon